MNINDVISQTNKNKARKRGRPRKNSTIPTKSNGPRDKKNEMIEEDIILHFPLSSQDINKEQVNGFELIQTECNEDANSTESNLSENEDSEKTYQQLLNVIKEKDKIINDLESKLMVSSEALESVPIIAKDVKLYSIDTPFDKNDKGNIIVPEYTDKACLWDTCEIGGVPCFLPDKYYDGTFYVVGLFCSLNCAVAYNLSLDDFKISERYSLLKWMYGKTQEKISPSPPCRVLTKFGGIVSIDDYRKNLHKCEKDYRIILPPMACISQTLEERHRVPVKRCSGHQQNNIIDAMKHKKKIIHT